MNIRNRKLHRYPGEAILLGIAAGIGHFFEVDPVFVRLVWLLLAVLLNVWPLILLYVVLFFIMPIDPSQQTVPANQTPKDVTPEAPAPEKMDKDQNM